MIKKTLIRAWLLLWAIPFMAFVMATRITWKEEPKRKTYEK